MGRPDVGGDEENVGTDLEADLQKVTAVEAENRPAVGLEIADGPEPAVELVDGGETRQRDDVVDFSCTAVLLVDRTDLYREHEPQVSPARRMDLDVQRLGQCRFEAEYPVPRRFQFLLDLREPIGVSEVGRADQVDALQRRPFVQILRVQIATGRPGIVRVEMYVGHEGHRRTAPPVGEGGRTEG